MVNLQYNLQDTFWQPTLAHEHNLSLLLSKDRFSYCVTDLEHRVLVLRAYQIPDVSPSSLWQLLLAQDAWLGLAYRSVRAGIWSENYELLPTAPLPEVLGNAKSYDRIQKAGLVGVYVLPTDWVKVLSNQYKSLQCMHACTGWLQQVFNTPRITASAQLFLHVRANQIQLAGFEQDKLVYLNRFEYQTSTDCLYFVLLAYEKLGLDPNTQALAITGDLVEDSEIYGLLYKYVRYAQFSPRLSQLQFGEVFGILPAHFYTDLFGIAAYAV